MSNRLQFEQDRLSVPEVLAADHPSLWDQVRAAWRRHHSRQRIADLDPYLLKDIGVSRSEAEHEANKPFWQI